MNRICRLICLSAVFSVSFQLQAQVKKKPVKKATTAARKPVKKVIKTTVAAVPKEQFTRVKITTDMGEMVVKLYNKTPQHRDNFIKLVTEHFFDSLLFHRVINGFMIQGGDPESKHAESGTMLGNGDVGYTIPAEFDSTLFHKKGALCAARTDNPEMASSGCQFYIVQGKKMSAPELENIQMQNGRRYSSAQKMTYKMNGGTPFLDSRYTVFGEVESGIDVIDKIALAQTDGANRPLTDVRMQMELLPDQPEIHNKKISTPTKD